MSSAESVPRRNAAIRRGLSGSVGLAALVYFLAAYAQGAQLEPPGAVGGLQLVHALRGKEALQAIDRLHGNQLGGADGYVAHYERNGFAAMLYVSRASRSSMAGLQIERMAARIRKGDTPFYHLKSQEWNGSTVFSALGQGQIHYFYRQDADVTWIASDPAVAKEVVDQLLRRDR